MDAGIQRIERAVAWLDILLLVVTAFGASWFMYASNEAAKEAARIYGHNIDAGAIESVAAFIYFIPNALLFFAASLSMWWRWRPRWFIQTISAIWLIGPFVWDAWDESRW